MAKVMFSILLLALTGCASIGQWRELRIDGTSEIAFGQSLSALDAELPYSYRQMFALALVDIERTEARNAERTSDGGDNAYTEEDYRNRLHGLTYEGVIALADQTGPSIRSLYYSGAGRTDPWRGRPWPQTNPDRFPAGMVAPPPGLVTSFSNGER